MTNQLVKQIIATFFLLLGLITFIVSLVVLRNIVVLLFLAFIMASALYPLVEKFKQYNIPRPATILFLYIILFTTIAVLVGLIVPPLVIQTTALINSLSRFLGVDSVAWNGFESLDFKATIGTVNQFVSQYESIFGQIQNSITTILEIIFSTFSLVFILFTFLIATFYLLLNMNQVVLAFAWMLPGKPAEQVQHSSQIFHNVRNQLGSWVSGQLALMLVIGMITYIGLTLLGVPYALPLALLAGLLEIVPNVGPTVAAIPSVIIGFLMMNPLMGGVLILFYVLVQQAENNLIVPFIMRRAVDVRPLTTLIVILAGFSLMNVAGALLAVPFYITVRSVVRDLWPDSGPFADYSKYLPK